MNGSGIFRLGWADLVRGLIVAVLSAVLTYLYSGLLGDGTLDLAELDWRKVGGISAAATAAYLLKNLVSDADGKALGKIGGFVLALFLAVGLTACTGGSGGSSAGGGQPPDPCAQEDQILTGTGLAITTAQTGYAILTVAGTVKAGSTADIAIAASFDAANAALAQARVDRLAGRCDPTSAVMAINVALATAARDIAAAKAASEAAKAAEKQARKDAKAQSPPVGVVGGAAVVK